MHRHFFFTRKQGQREIASCSCDAVTTAMHASAAYCASSFTHVTRNKDGQGCARKHQRAAPSASRPAYKDARGECARARFSTALHPTCEQPLRHVANYEEGRTNVITFWPAEEQQGGSGGGSTGEPRVIYGYIRGTFQNRPRRCEATDAAALAGDRTQQKASPGAVVYELCHHERFLLFSFFGEGHSFVLRPQPVTRKKKRKSGQYRAAATTWYTQWAPELESPSRSR